MSSKSFSFSWQKETEAESHTERDREGETHTHTRGGVGGLKLHPSSRCPPPTSSLAHSSSSQEARRRGQWQSKGWNPAGKRHSRPGFAVALSLPGVESWNLHHESHYLTRQEFSQPHGQTPERLPEDRSFTTCRALETAAGA